MEAKPCPSEAYERTKRAVEQESVQYVYKMKHSRLRRVLSSEIVDFPSMDQPFLHQTMLVSKQVCNALSPARERHGELILLCYFVLKSVREKESC